MAHRKQTSDVSPDLQRYIGRNQACTFYATKGILLANEFDLIRWEGVKGALSNKP